MKKLISVIMLVAIVFTLSACADNMVKGSVVNVSDGGDAILDIMPQKLLEQVDIGNMVTVSIGDLKKEMPFVDELITEEGKLQLFYDKDEHNINVIIYNKRFCDVYDIEVNDRVRIKKN